MKFWRKYGKPLLVIVFLLFLWKLAVMSRRWSAYVLPDPEKVWHSFCSMAASGTLAEHILVSFRRVAVGFSIAFVLAFLLALAFVFQETDGRVLWVFT